MRVFDRLETAKERRLLQRSIAHPFVRCYQRDDFKYFDKGRSVLVSGELMTSRDPQRIIYRRCPLVWEQSGQPLTSDEREQVFRCVGQYLDRKKIKWAFSDADPA
jgi:hypothetical protein